jgi:KDO2-lipid IV(A) lauroyltransferase
LESVAARVKLARGVDQFRHALLVVDPPHEEQMEFARLPAGDIVLFPFDQHAGGRDGIEVDFFGHPAGTFRSLALIARATGAPVVPAASWREHDGRHVLRFVEPLIPIECEDYDEEIRRNTQAYNAALERLILRHPEQWWWMHRRWKSRRNERS